MEDKKDLIEKLCSTLYDHWWDISEEVMLENPDYGKVDLVCRKVNADILTMKDLANELKRKEVVK